VNKNGRANMPKKPKFKPEITRVKLNPEQAVLTCSCYSMGYQYQGAPIIIDDPLPPADETHFLGPKNAYADANPIACMVVGVTKTAGASPDFITGSVSS
jgi:hypothetical protein